jgi:predicted RNA-binding protein with PIN domain
MSAPRPADPLHLTDWLIVDGNNLLHALSSSTTPAPRSALVGRLRGAIPASIAIDVVFDGPASPGLGGERIASGLRVRYAGRRTADAVILLMVEEIRVADGPAATAAILVVTDDGDLRHRLRTKGARMAGTSWLLDRLRRQDRSASPAPGTGGRTGTGPPAKPGGQPTGPADPSAPESGSDDDAPRWEPGRRATVKKGNPYRRRRRATDGRR